MLVHVDIPTDGRPPAVQAHFEQLPARPMVSLLFQPANSQLPAVTRQLGELLSALPADAVVQVRVAGPHAD